MHETLLLFRRRRWEERNFDGVGRHSSDQSRGAFTGGALLCRWECRFQVAGANRPHPASTTSLMRCNVLVMSRMLRRLRRKPPNNQ